MKTIKKGYRRKKRKIITTIKWEIYEKKRKKI